MRDIIKTFDDLSELPAAAHAFDPSSRPLVRTLGEDGMNIDCRAAPRDAAR